jgi:spermidine/putrescine transport system ATP-binding protein
MDVVISLHEVISTDIAVGLTGPKGPWYHRPATAVPLADSIPPDTLVRPPLTVPVPSPPAAPKRPSVVLRKVVKDYPAIGGGTFRAVNEVSIEIADGEFFSLLGPSGCGKSTTLRMLAGFEEPTTGDIDIEGRPMVGVPPYDRPVNMVFQSYALFPHLSVAKNLSFGLEMKHVPRAEMERRVAAALDLVRLPGMGERRPGQLSGGQQQRVALARALINEPEVLLLDEPLGALDLKLRKEMQLELKALQRRVGITFVYVTHDQEEALTMSDRIAVMNEGRILQVAAPTTIYERPNCRFVADFIGEVNFLEGHVARPDGRFATVDITGTALHCVGLAQGQLSPGQAVSVAVRPEKIQLTPDRPADVANAFAAVVEDVAYIGSDTRVALRMADALSILVWDTNEFSTLDPDYYYRRGEQVWISWPAENALVLDA